MAQDNVDVVQSAWDAFGRGDIEAVLDELPMTLNQVMSLEVGQTLLLNANVLFPMTDGGLKPKPTLVFGLDYVF